MIGREGFYRTGGDKWIQPYYKDILAGILTQSNWSVNDISRLNGGVFSDHKEHVDGTDADVFLKEGAIFNLRKSHTPEEWIALVTKIDEFIAASQLITKTIDKYYISTTHRLNQPEARLYIESKLQYRCIGERYININKDKFSKSLIRDVDGHHDHLHISFEKLNGSGLPNRKNLPRAEEVNLDDFQFELTQSGDDYYYLVIPQPEKVPLYYNKYVFSRFQNQETLEDSNFFLLASSWESIDSKQKTNFSPRTRVGALDELKYLNVTVANRADGSCIDVNLEIDSSQFVLNNRNGKIKFRLSEKKTLGDYELLFD